MQRLLSYFPPGQHCPSLCVSKGWMYNFLGILNPNTLYFYGLPECVSNLSLLLYLLSYAGLQATGAWSNAPCGTHRAYSGDSLRNSR